MRHYFIFASTAGGCAGLAYFVGFTWAAAPMPRAAS
jgi:hypothetical protein